jgi:hypothetical protein
MTAAVFEQMVGEFCECLMRRETFIVRRQLAWLCSCSAVGGTELGCAAVVLWEAQRLEQHSGDKQDGACRYLVLCRSVGVLSGHKYL